jgi:hypothetical protein
VATGPYEPFSILDRSGRRTWTIRDTRDNGVRVPLKITSVAHAETLCGVMNDAFRAGFYDGGEDAIDNTEPDEDVEKVREEAFQEGYRKAMTERQDPETISFEAD